MKQTFAMGLLVVLMLLGCFTLKSDAQNLCVSGVCVLTWHNDNYRTGDNLNETILTYDAINKDTFGQRCSVTVDGQVFGQPLVVTGTSLSQDPVVYVVTMNDTLYAIDGTPPSGNQSCTILNGSGTSLLKFLPAGQFAVPCGDISQCGTIAPLIGVLGTPVIDRSTGTMYLVTETEDGAVPPNFYHYLHAINIQTFTEASGSPVRVAPPGSDSGQKSKFSHDHIQRPGLLLASCGSSCNKIYVAFSMMDGNPPPYPNGAIFGYNAASLSEPPLYLPTSQGLTNKDGGGI